MIQLIANSITIVALLGVIICGLLTIRDSRKAAANWKLAEENWKRTEAARKRSLDAKTRIRAAQRKSR